MELQCWRCGASLAGLSLPIGRTEECPGCHSQLHVCRMCQSYDPRVPKQCREDDAEEVRSKDRANFCDWFKPRAGAFDSAGAAADQAARSAAEALFGPPKPKP
ncbi:MAG: hypothetical protein DYH20_07200 [Gammaproteobacteria bacterium PRO9]|nr:hypothetical protein [Gammaproteobacteria bacterium PRO9]